MPRGKKRPLLTRRGHHYGSPLVVHVKGGELRVVIGIGTLAHAASYSDWANPHEDESGDYIRTFAIVNTQEFAEDVAHAMLREREDGSSPLSDFIDKMMEAAIEDGSMACEYDQRIKHGTTSPLETWAQKMT
jgi:hypothetical protein